MSNPKVPPPQNVKAHWSNDPDEPVTNPGMKIPIDPGSPSLAATPEYVKTKVEVVTQRLDDEADFTDGLLTKIKGLGGLLIGTIALTASVLVGLDTRAQNKADAVDAGSVARDRKQDAEIERLREGQQRAALESVRVVVMLEQLTEKARLPVPPPVVLPPRDGGR